MVRNEKVPEELSLQGICRDKKQVVSNIKHVDVYSTSNTQVQTDAQTDGRTGAG